MQAINYLQNNERVNIMRFITVALVLLVGCVLSSCGQDDLQETKAPVQKEVTPAGQYIQAVIARLNHAESIFDKFLLIHFLLLISFHKLL